METYSFKFLMQNEIFKFAFTGKSQSQVKGDKFKEWNAKKQN